MVTSALICFEDIFPQLARDGGREAPDFLVNLTNDGWFGQSAEQWQHAASALFRSVENGLPLIRCANNGLTCWIDSRGRLHGVLRDSSGNVYGPAFATFEIPLLAAGRQIPRPSIVAMGTGSAGPVLPGQSARCFGSFGDTSARITHILGWTEPRRDPAAAAQAACSSVSRKPCKWRTRVGWRNLRRALASI